MYNPVIMYKAIENSPYIGKVLADRIINWDVPCDLPDLNFEVNDLDKVKGLGPKKKADLEFQYHKLVSWGW